MLNGIFKSIKRKILGLLLITAVVPLIIFFIITSWDRMQALKHEIGVDFRQSAHEIAHNIELLIGSKIKEVEIFGLTSSIVREAVLEANADYNDNPEEQIIDEVRKRQELWKSSGSDYEPAKNIITNKAAKRLKDHQATMPEEYLIILVTDIKGGLVAATDRPDDYYFGEKVWWQKTFNYGRGALFIDEITYVPKIQSYLLNISAPVKNDDGQVIGVMRSVINIKRLLKFISILKFGKTGHAELITSAGQIILGSNFLAPREPLDKIYLKNIDSCLSLGGWFEETCLHTKDESLIGCAAVHVGSLMESGIFRGDKWYVLVSQDIKEALLPLQKYIFRAAGRIGLILVCIFFLGIMLANNISSPILQLKDNVDIIGQGNLQQQIFIHTDDEIAALAQAFNKMSEKLNTIQAKLIKSAKLVTMGTFSAAIFHDLNGPLLGIIGYTQFVRQKLEQMDNEAIKNIEPYFNLIEEESLRCKEIIDNYYVFTGEAPRKFEVVNLSEVINGCISIIEDDVRAKHIKLAIDVPKELPLLYGNRSQLMQAFLNLIINAIQAMPDSGQIDIKAEKVVDKFNENLLKISFKDNGVGIKKESLTKIFDPFFTTKEGMQSLGLGLSIVRQIIMLHQGKIFVNTEINKGTEFIVELPIKFGARKKMGAQDE